MLQNTHQCNKMPRKTTTTTIPLGRPSVTFSDIVIMEDDQKCQNRTPLNEKTPLSIDFEEEEENNKNKRCLTYFWNIFKEKINGNDKIIKEDTGKIRINFFIWCAPIPLIVKEKFLY
ncbi:unnamed protein product [Meloidogyne enterolobii]|uniref:Uncharacterized protein n=1 Tax=Meloidogyne enterolobii TaxID=390850 RepID=A0ACB0YZF4_MELEN